MKINIAKFITPAFKAAKKHSPEILTGIGIAGMLGSVILAVKATPKAVKIAEEKDAKTAGDVVKATWSCYIPTAVTFACSAACLVGASATNLRRNAALATAYSLSETAMKEYQAKTKEIIGEKKEQTIRDEIASDKVRAMPKINTENDPGGMNTTLCCDGVLGRCFYSNIETIRRAAAEVNTQIVADGYASINDFYEKLDLDDCKAGELLGWGSYKTFEPHFSSTLATDGTPVLVFTYSVIPDYNYFG